MNGFESPSVVSRKIPWRPIAILVSAVFLVVLLSVMAWRFIAWRQQESLMDAAVLGLEADLARSLERCNEAKNPDACAQEEVIQQAASFGLAELCDELEGDAHDQCVWAVARQQEDPKECEAINDVSTKQACEDNLWYRLGKGQLLRDACREIDDASLEESCLSYVVYAIAAKDGCEAAGLDVSVCEARDRLAFVLETKDPELCQTIPDEDLAAECEEGIGPGDPDFDGIITPTEEEMGTDPRSADTDSDGLLDGEEDDLETDPLNPDTDGDGYLDGAEVAAGYSPRGEGALE